MKKNFDFHLSVKFAVALLCTSWQSLPGTAICPAPPIDVLAPSSSQSNNIPTDVFFDLPSTQAWNFAKYGNTPVNLYTGTLSVDIPIYTYKDEDIEIPISVGYASNGLKPNERVGILGTGWFLNAGGVITREVRGVPDEYNDGFVYGAYYIGLLTKDEARKFSAVEYAPDQAIKQTYYSNSTGTNTGTRLYDTSADIFHFNFIGYRGSFILGSEGKVHVFDSNVPHGEIKIDFSVHSLNSKTGYFVFRITTGDGYTYTFGEGLKDKEYAYTATATGNRDDPNYLKSTVAWVLSSIAMSNGRKVSFNYQEYDFDNPGNKNTANILTTYSPSYLKQGYEYKTSNGNSGSSNNVDDKNKKSYIKPLLLKSIVIADRGTTISFVYTKDYGSEKYYDDMYNVKTPPSVGRLDRIVVTGFNDTQYLRYVQFDYKTTAVTNRLFLSGIEIDFLENYIFDYYSFNGTFPYTGTKEVDYWGYYNGRTDNNFKPDPQDKYGNENIDLAKNRPADADKSIAGMLLSITYPTGGKTTYEYECNNSSKVVSREYSLGFLPYLKNQVNSAGGLRIKTITDSAENKIVNKRDFFYQNLSGESSGILLSAPWFYLEYETQEGSTTKRKYTLVSSSGPITMTEDNSHVGYSRVIEKLSDGGQIEYCYTDYEHIPDDKNYYTELISNLDITSPSSGRTYSKLIFKINSTHIYRGKLLSKTVYDNGKNPKYQEEYEYEDFTGKYLANVDIQGCYLYQYKIYIGSYNPKNIKKTTYFGANSVVTTESFTYNDYGQITSTGIKDGKGVIRYAKTIRPLDKWGRDHIKNPQYFVEQSMIDRNLVSFPLETKTTFKNPNESEKLTEATRYTYSLFNSLIKPAQLDKTELTTPLLSTSINLEPYFQKEVSYDKYNALGNPLQITNKDHIKTCYIWGYKGLYVVAKIENATIDQITKIDGLSSIETTPLTGNLSTNQITELYKIENAQVSVFDYKPYIGLQSMTDPSGRKINYQYDRYGRLIMVYDDDGMPVKGYEYHYKQ